jgi:predicted DNA-binding transcriptional regulator YafY
MVNLTVFSNHTQRLVKENEDNSIMVHLFISPNYEMERILLGFGDGIEIIKPENLRNRMKKMLKKAVSRYEPEDNTELKS